MARLKGLIQASVLSRKPPTKRDIEEIEVNRDWLSAGMLTGSGEFLGGILGIKLENFRKF
jgi:hypothetical protein